MRLLSVLVLMLSLMGITASAFQQKPPKPKEGEGIPLDQEPPTRVDPYKNVPDSVDVMPAPDGMTRIDYRDHIESQLIRPDPEVTKEIRVVVKFIVNANGSLSDFTVPVSLGPAYSEEAIRVINEGPAWTPGRRGGMELRVVMTMPVYFRAVSMQPEVTNIVDEAMKQAEQNPDPDEIHVLAEIMPEPHGMTLEQYHADVQNRLVTPNARPELKGKVFLVFVVNIDGSLSDFSVMRGLSKAYDDEAIRVIKEGPVWNPGQLNGKKVRVKVLYPVEFKYP